MARDIIDGLPSVEEIEQALAQNRQNAYLLRSIRSAMKRRSVLQNVSSELRRQIELTAKSEVQHDA
jgi:hypothetical protein